MTTLHAGFTIDVLVGESLTRYFTVVPENFTVCFPVYLDPGSELGVLYQEIRKENGYPPSLSLLSRWIAALLILTGDSPEKFCCLTVILYSKIFF